MYLKTRRRKKERTKTITKIQAKQNKSLVLISRLFVDQKQFDYGTFHRYFSILMLQYIFVR